jgi:tetrahydromethanopterin S-methyltransferase subunit C
VYLFILVAILVYAILAATLSKRMTLRLPLCAKHLEKYRSLKIASALLLLGCLPEMIVAGTLLPEKYMPLGIVAGLLALIAGVVCLALFNGLLQVNRIDDYYGYFSKASEGFLAHLPPAPPGMTLPR